MSTRGHNHNPEAAEQAAVVSLLRRSNVEHVGVLNQHVRSHWQQVQASSEGFQPGFPDFLVLTRPPAWPMLAGTAVEMKKRSATMSAMEPDQVKWQQRLKDCGWAAIVGFGSDDAIYKLQVLGYLPDVRLKAPPARPAAILALYVELVTRYGEPAMTPYSQLCDWMLAANSVPDDGDPDLSYMDGPLAPSRQTPRAKKPKKDTHGQP